MHILKASSSILRSNPFLVIFRQPSPTMKIKTAALTCWLPLSSRAWVPSRPPVSKSMITTRQAFSSSSYSSVSSLQASAVVPESSEAELVAFPNAGRVVATGSVVSFFRGGLSAIRIEEENVTVKGVAGSPEVLSPSDTPAVVKKVAATKKGAPAMSELGKNYTALSFKMFYSILFLIKYSLGIFFFSSPQKQLNFFQHTI